ncbi:TerB-C domain-containing protein [Lachnospiraceae bacterium]|nr:TerB-C domain-containing protein [Lachnospiraceae bacterium]
MGNGFFSDNSIDVRFTDGYHDEALPLRKDRPAAPKTPLPDKLQWMKAIASEVHTFPKPESWYFYKQGQFAADYTDDYEFTGVFRRYFPTYKTMKDNELRGYFSFRTRFRNGFPDQSPQLSFLYVYIYEILNGIGVTPQEGFEILLKIDRLYGHLDVTLKDHLRRWIRDYIIYYGLDHNLASEYFSVDMDSALSVLMQAFSEAEDPECDPSVPDDALFDALLVMSSYDIKKSTLYKKDPELTKSTIVRVIRELSAGMKRLSRDTLFEYCFGRRGVFSVKIFQNAVFYDHKKYTDYAYEISPICSYHCRDGAWSREAYGRFAEPSRILGDICHETDRVLRDKTGLVKSIKRRLMNDIFAEEISWIVDRFLKEREEAAKPRIEIDLSMLDSIRRDAAETRDSLIVEEETHSENVSVESDLHNVENLVDSDLHNIDKIVPDISGDISNTSENIDILSDRGEPESSLHNQEFSGEFDLHNIDSFLSPDEIFVLHALLYGEPWKDYVQSHHLMINMLCDSINDQMMDIIGDTVIEFNEDEPELIEDYIPDLKDIIPEK